MRFATDFFSDLYQDYKIYYETNRVVAEATDKVWLVVLDLSWLLWCAMIL